MLQERGLVLLGGGEDEEEEVTKLKIVHDHSVGVLAYPIITHFKTKHLYGILTRFKFLKIFTETDFFCCKVGVWGKSEFH